MPASRHPSRCNLSRGAGMTPRRSPLALVLASVLASLGALALLAAPALAANTRNFDTQITGQTPPNASVSGPFVEPRGIAVDAAGNVWISDISPERHGVITEYDPNGGYLSQKTGVEHPEHLAFNDATGFLYSADAGPQLLEIFDDTGSFVSKFSIGLGGYGVSAVAVDNTGGPTQGRIYTDSQEPFDGTYGGNVRAFEPGATEASDVHNFTASGEPGNYLTANAITGTSNGPFADLNQGDLATDPQGDIYVVDVSGQVIDEFAPSGEFLREFTGAEVPGEFGPGGVAVDPLNRHVLIVNFHGPVVDEFDSSGKYLGQIAGPSPNEPFGELHNTIAFNSEGYLYVPDRGDHLVDEFLPLGEGPLPAATTGEATEIHRTTAALHAEVELNGGAKVTSCRFEYVASAEYEPWRDNPYAQGPSAATVPCLNPSGHEVGAGEPVEGPTELHAPIAAIRAGTAYDYRVTVANEEFPTHSGHGSDRTFQTPPAVTELKTESVTELTQKSATLNASFTAEEGLPTEYFFEYGTSTDYGHTTPVVTVPGATAVTETDHLEASVTQPELVPDTTYHFRIVARNSYVTPTYGEDETFTTYQPPTIVSVSSSHVTATSADLEATVNPQGLPSGTITQCRFEYGTTTSYGSTVPCPEALEGTSAVPVQVEVGGLQSGATYHFRLVAQSKWGTFTSEDHSFEFFPPSCPNQAVRQQTSSSYLPDCRAYELVSPGNANGTLLYSAGPTSPTATSPSRFAFTGAFSSVPGNKVIGTDGDLYVSTRTDTGWVSHYVGLPGNEASCAGPAPDGYWSPPPRPTNSRTSSPPTPR